MLVERLDIFQIFNYWLEHGNLDFMDRRDYFASEEDALIAFVEIYTFADCRGVFDLGDQILQKLDKLIRPGGMPVRLDTDIINRAWQHLPETCGLCRYLVAIEHDANKCNLPKRTGIEYEWLSGYFTASLLKLTEDDWQRWPRAVAQKEPINIAKLHDLVKRNGGWANVDQLHRWGEICYTMGIRASGGFDQENRLRAHVRRLYVRYLRPWDKDLSPAGLELAERECPRPLVKKYFHGVASAHAWR